MAVATQTNVLPVGQVLVEAEIRYACSHVMVHGFYEDGRESAISAIYDLIEAGKRNPCPDCEEVETVDS